MKKPTRTQQKAKADRLFSKRIRERGFCEATGYRGITCSPTLQCCHIIRRRYLAVRWDEDNALAMCGAHHVFFSYHDLEWRLFIDAQYPGRWDQLQAKALGDHSKPDYEAILERLAA